MKIILDCEVLESQELAFRVAEDFIKDYYSRKGYGYANSCIYRYKGIGVFSAHKTKGGNVSVRFLPDLHEG